MKENLKMKNGSVKIMVGKNDMSKEPEMKRNGIFRQNPAVLRGKRGDRK